MAQYKIENRGLAANVIYFLMKWFKVWNELLFGDNDP